MLIRYPMRFKDFPDGQNYMKWDRKVWQYSVHGRKIKNVSCTHGSLETEGEVDLGEETARGKHKKGDGEREEKVTERKGHSHFRKSLSRLWFLCISPLQRLSDGLPTQNAQPHQKFLSVTHFDEKIRYFRELIRSLPRYMFQLFLHLNHFLIFKPTWS